MKKLFLLSILVSVIVSSNAQTTQHQHSHDHICSACGGSYVVVYPHIVKYAGNIGINAGAVIDARFYSDIDYNTVLNRPAALGFTFENGMSITKRNWNNSVFVGIGTGLHFLYQNTTEIFDHFYCPYPELPEHDNVNKSQEKSTFMYLPVYLTTRVNFNKNNKVSPFIKFNEGALIGLTEFYNAKYISECPLGHTYVSQYDGDTQDTLYSYQLLTGLEAGVSVKVSKDYSLSFSASYTLYNDLDNGLVVTGHQLQGVIRFEI